MKLLFLVLICFFYSSTAYAESYTAALNFTMSKTREGGVKDGRGVGGGYGCHVKDFFLGLSLDLVKVVDSSVGNKRRNEKVFSELSHNDEKNNLDIDADKFVDFIYQGKVRLVQDGDAYAPQGVSYNLVDGVLYLNSTVWDKKAMQNNYEEEVIHVLLIATNQADENGKVSKYYGDLIRAKRFKDSFLDAEIKPRKFFE